MFEVVFAPVIEFLIILFFVLVLNTLRIQRNSQQSTFLKGSIPHSMPDGFLKGSAFYTGPWKGKKFNATERTGINILHWGSHETEEFPFKTYVGKGIKDTSLDVIKIDYNIPENPVWLHPILDEIVETAPGEFLGKMHIRLPFGFAFSVVYFSLKTIKT